MVGGECSFQEFMVFFSGIFDLFYSCLRCACPGSRLVCVYHVRASGFLSAIFSYEMI